MSKGQQKERKGHQHVRMTSTRVAKGVSNADFVYVCPENNDVEIETFFVLIDHRERFTPIRGRRWEVFEERCRSGHTRRENRKDDGSFSREHIR